MAKRLASSFVNLVYTAILKSFWRKKALWRFLRQVGIAETFLATWGNDESKREFEKAAELDSRFRSVQ